MSQLNSLLESSASNWKNMQSDAARLADKWDKTGLLEGMGNEVHKNNMSMILENQAKQLVVEQSSTNQGGGSFAVGQGAQWAGIALPLVRKVFGQIAAKEFVSVQPMNLPSGLVFYLDFQYGTDKELNFGPAGDAFGSSNGGGSGSLYGNTNPGVSSDPTQGLYGSGRFGYSINQFSQSVTFTVASVATSSWSDVDYQAEKSSSISSGNFTTVTVAGTDLTRPDYKGARAFIIVSGSNVNLPFRNSADKLLPEFTRVDLSLIHI